MMALAVYFNVLWNKEHFTSIKEPLFALTSAEIVAIEISYHLDRLVGFSALGGMMWTSGIMRLRLLI